MKKGSQRTPAKTLTPCPCPPLGSFTRKVTDSPVGVVQVPSCSGGRRVRRGCPRTEDAVEDELLLADDKGRARLPGGNRQGPQSEAIDQTVREGGVRLGERAGC